MVFVLVLPAATRCVTVIWLQQFGSPRAPLRYVQILALISLNLNFLRYRNVNYYYYRLCLIRALLTLYYI